MTQERHAEQHFTLSQVVRDAVIGMADGLTVPFALAAGLSGAISDNSIVVVAGLAEIAAGSIAMGLGGYLAGRGDVEHYVSERTREHREVHEMPGDEVQEIVDIFKSYGIAEDECRPVVESLKKRPDKWVDFMMRFELGLEKPDPRRPLRSAVTIGGAYVAGGIIPLVPYMLLDQIRPALWISAGVTLCALAVFGYAKSRITGRPPLRSALHTLLVGGLAATAAYLIASLFT